MSDITRHHLKKLDNDIDEWLQYRISSPSVVKHDPTKNPGPKAKEHCTTLLLP